MTAHVFERNSCLSFWYGACPDETGRAFGSRVFGSRVFGSRVFGSRVFGSRLFGSHYYGLHVCSVCRERVEVSWCPGCGHSPNRGCCGTSAGEEAPGIGDS